jgi:hypothetical protein
MQSFGLSLWIWQIIGAFAATNSLRFERSSLSIESSFWRNGMSTLVESSEVTAIEVSCSADELKVVLGDGRTVSVPLAWFPRLLAATPKQRTAWELIGGGIGIHWEAIDEDILVASLLQPENFMRLPDQALQGMAQKRRRR